MLKPALITTTLLGVLFVNTTFASIGNIPATKYVNSYFYNNSSNSKAVALSPLCKARPDLCGRRVWP